MNTLQQFEETLSGTMPPTAANVYLKALWYDAKGNWDEAHNLVQDLADRNAAWVHAYLHRKEGDTANADYWYYKAARKRQDETLQQEWEQMVMAFLKM